MTMSERKVKILSTLVDILPTNDEALSTWLSLHRSQDFFSQLYNVTMALNFRCYRDKIVDYHAALRSPTTSKKVTFRLKNRNRDKYSGR